MMGKTKKASMALFETVLIAVILSCIALNTYWLFEKDAYSVSTEVEGVQPIEKGGFISYNRYVCSSKSNVSSKITRYVVWPDGYSQVIESYEIPAINTCGISKVRWKTPYYLPAGKYKYVAIVRYDINPLKSVTKQLSPIAFEVKDGN